MTTDPAQTPDRRRPRSVYGHGAEPDARASLANIRTTLAWIRTGLALVAAGVGLTSLVTLADLTGALHVVGALACLAGGGVALAGLRSWISVERALRTRSPLPTPRAVVPLAAAVAVLAVLMAGYALGSTW